MARELYVSCRSHFTWVALKEEGRLVELTVEPIGLTGQAGNFYMGRVADVLPGMQAAFIDIGLERNAFLYIADLLSPLKGQEEYPPIGEKLRPGDQILVQVKKESVGQKGARVTTQFALPGRFLVYLPTGEEVGISRKIEGESERQRLNRWGERQIRSGEGLILRTAAESATEQELQADLDFLRLLWQSIQEEAKSAVAPTLVHEEVETASRVVRDWIDQDLARIVLDREEEYRRLRRFIGRLLPDKENRVYLYEGKGDLFRANGIQADLDKALRRKVWLENGSYVVFDVTEALVAIDVNTGKYTGKESLSETVLQTNLQACKEIARQIRLRDLGGIIVIDFIDMRSEEHRQEVLRFLRQELSKDRMRINLLGYTSLGLVELTRKKNRQNLRELLYTPCSCCQQLGVVPKLEAVGDEVERQLAAQVAAVEGEAVMVELHPALAAHFIGPGGSGIGRLAKSLGRKVIIKGNAHLAQEQFRLLASGSEMELRRQAVPVREGETLSVRIEAPHHRLKDVGIARIDGYVLQVKDGASHLNEQVRIQIEEVHATYATARLFAPMAPAQGDPC